MVPSLTPTTSSTSSPPLTSRYVSISYPTPYPYSQAPHQATFFVNGNNFGNINDFQAVVRRMIADGHQVGSHTYAHPDLATLGDAAVITAMTDLEEALDAIIGVTPTYMRPPFFSYNDQTLAVLGELGYHVIHADIDTFDYMFRDIGNLTGAANLEAGIAAGGNLALAHDVSLNRSYFLENRD
jgi:peptidoglycan/xylan/chitin deacetylase (PgdA/CDA1 family)